SIFVEHGIALAEPLLKRFELCAFAVDLGSARLEQRLQRGRTLLSFLRAHDGFPPFDDVDFHGRRERCLGVEGESRDKESGSIPDHANLLAAPKHFGGPLGKSRPILAWTNDVVCGCGSTVARSQLQ